MCYLARVSAIQLAVDVDEMAAETYVTVANRTILLRAPLDDLRDALTDNFSAFRGTPPCGVLGPKGLLWTQNAADRLDPIGIG